MGHAVGDIIQVTFQYQVSQNQMMNILHYRVESSSSTATDIADNQSLADYLAAQTGAGQWLDVWASGLGSTTSFVSARVQKISPFLTPYALEPIVMTGQIVDNCNIPNVAMTITKRGQAGGRQGIGSLHLGGIPDNRAFAGNWAGNAQAWWTSLSNFFVNNITTPLTNITYKPCIYNKGAIPPYNYVLDWQRQNSVRTMHRRTLQLGI